MIRLKLKNRFCSTLRSEAAPELIVLANPATVALEPSRIPFVKPRLLVREQDRVSIGTPLYTDKRNPALRFLSPGAGAVESIRFGKRRVIQEIIIRLDPEETRETFLSMERNLIASAQPETLIQRLVDGGLWQLMEQLPFRDYPDPKQSIPMIIVSLRPGDMFSPLPETILTGREDLFLAGIDILGRLTKSLVVAAPAASIPNLNAISHTLTHVTDDTFPAGDPAVILYQVRTAPDQNRACHVGLQDLLAMADLVLNGTFPTTRIITRTGSRSPKPVHLKSRAGSPLQDLAGSGEPGRDLLTHGIFNGHRPPGDAHLGFRETSVILLDGPLPDALFGFARLGLHALTESRTFASSLVPGKRDMDTGLHGEVRACINCGLCDKKCPVDLLPQFILKTVLAEEMEEALSLGLLDCAECGLCTFVCPSKIEVSSVLQQAKHALYKERTKP
ncbi:MAG: 4Fe-4S dicluster domain-containing protein [Pseudomonadota bacterium]